MKDLDLKTAITLVQEAISARGEDYVYERPGISCQYVDARSGKLTPSCLVGDALIRYGVDPEWFISSNNNGEPSRPVVRQAAEHFGFHYDEKVLDFLANIQASQDDGAPWGEAFQAALRGNFVIVAHSGKHYEESGDGGPIDCESL